MTYFPAHRGAAGAGKFSVQPAHFALCAGKTAGALENRDAVFHTGVFDRPGHLRGLKLLLPLAATRHLQTAQGGNPAKAAWASCIIWRQCSPVFKLI